MTTPTPPARFILVYTNDNGTTTSHRQWTLEEAERRLDALNAANGGDSGRWTIHETNEVTT